MDVTVLTPFRTTPALRRAVADRASIGFAATLKTISTDLEKAGAWGALPLGEGGGIPVLGLLVLRLLVLPVVRLWLLLRGRGRRAEADRARVGRATAAEPIATALEKAGARGADCGIAAWREGRCRGAEGGGGDESEDGGEMHFESGYDEV